MIYNIDLKLVAERLNVPSKRQPVTGAFLGALLEPLQLLNDETFGSYRNDVLKRLQYNSQRIMFESILNEFFDVQSENKIYIDNTDNNIERTFLYNEYEGYDPIIFYNEGEGHAPIFFYNEEEFISDYDFIVYVPSEWTTSDSTVIIFDDYKQKIINQVEKYRIIGVTYDVVSY